MKGTTNHESFILRPSLVHEGGVGVFALHDIAAGTYLELFSNTFEEELRNPADVPKELQSFCLTDASGALLCPKHFNQLDIGNYINHSDTANMRFEKGGGYFASRDIKAGEELLGNYRELGEPEESREEYYK